MIITAVCITRIQLIYWSVTWKVELFKKNAKIGKYIMFIDGDDWIDTNCIEVCVNEIEANSDIDIILFPYIKEYNGYKETINIFREKNYFFNEKETKEVLLKRLFGPSKPIKPSCKRM